MSEEEARAIEVTKGFKVSKGLTWDEWRELTARIAAALREARANGLKEAAQVAEDWHDHDITPGGCCYKKIATACRTQAQQARKEGP